jgi:hypothetical protein
MEADEMRQPKCQTKHQPVYEVVNLIPDMTITTQHFDF